MTSDEAIALLTGLKTYLPEVGLNKYMKSVELGIQALNAVKNTRLIVVIGPIPLLPGETKD